MKHKGGIEYTIEAIGYTHDPKYTTMHHKNLLNEVQRETGFVYLFHMEETPWYKIGKSNNPEKRLKEIQPTRLPSEIKLLHKIPTNYMSELEYTLHTQYAKQRKRGEWFYLTDEDIKAIQFLKMHKSDVVTEAQILLFAYEQRSGIDLAKWKPAPIRISDETAAKRLNNLNNTNW